MTTKKQMEANRRNAKLSTGPTTAAGLARSSKNALKHGLTAADVTVDDAEEKAFEAFRDDIVEDLGAVGTLEEELAQRIALGLWRLRRVPRLEMVSIKCCNQDNEDIMAPQFELMAAGTCENLIRYEIALDRSIQRSLHELERHQARRRREPVMAPIAVDVSHSITPGLDYNPVGPNANPRVTMGSENGASRLIGALQKPLKGKAASNRPA
jgi:hypothetical protein